MTGPKWLNADEMALWRDFVAATSSVMAQVEDALKADAGIGFDDYEVLVHLSEAEDHRLRMSDLSTQLLHSRSRLTQRIDRMADRGLVCREKCPEDKRGTFAVLTAEGMALIEAASIDHVRAVREHLIDRLDSEQIRSGRAMFEAILDAQASAGATPILPPRP